MSRSFKPRRNAQGGFTLVELVIVIVILGVLAAVALPRFINLQTDARQAKLNALSGSIRAAAAQVKAVSLVRAVSCGEAAIAAASSTVVLEGQPIALAYCYPQATDTGIVRAANISAANDGVVIDTTTAGTALITVNGATTAADCRITYVAPVATDTQPSITVSSSGC